MRLAIVVAALTAAGCSDRCAVLLSPSEIEPLAGGEVRATRTRSESVCEATYRRTGREAPLATLTIRAAGPMTAGDLRARVRPGYALVEPAPLGERAVLAITRMPTREEAAAAHGALTDEGIPAGASAFGSLPPRDHLLLARVGDREVVLTVDGSIEPAKVRALLPRIAARISRSPSRTRP